MNVINFCRYFDEFSIHCNMYLPDFVSVITEIRLIHVVFDNVYDCQENVFSDAVPNMPKSLSCCSRWIPPIVWRPKISTTWFLSNLSEIPPFRVISGQNLRAAVKATTMTSGLWNWREDFRPKSREKRIISIAHNILHILFIKRIDVWCTKRFYRF